MNKLGEETMKLYWYLIVVLVAGGIFAMVYIFYGAPYDVREIESQLLANRVADCLSREGVINSELVNETGFREKNFNNFLEICNLNFEVEDGYGNEVQYFVEVDFFEVENLEEEAFVWQEGNINWRSMCFIENKKDENYATLPKCTEERFYSVDIENKQYLIKIISGIGKVEKNVK